MHALHSWSVTKPIANHTLVSDTVNQRRIQMQFVLFPAKDRSGFWKQVDGELEALEKEMNEVEDNQRLQAWAE